MKRVMFVPGSVLVMVLFFCASVAAQEGKPKMPERMEMALEVKVSKVDKEGMRTPFAGASVLLDAMASPQMKIKTYTEKADDTGTATFKITAIKGGTYVPKVLNDGLNTVGATIVPDGPKKTVSIDVYGKTGDDSGILVTGLRTIVELSEGTLRFTQMWSIVNTSPLTFDPAASADEKYEDGFPIRLPKLAKGAHVRIMKGKSVVGEGEVAEDRALVKSAVPPMTDGQEPLNVNIIFAIDLIDSTLEYVQPVEYKVEGMQVIVPTQTRFKRMPTLDLRLSAPGFAEVGDNKNLDDLRRDTDFLVARGGQADAGGALKFSIEGYPVDDPAERKIALGLVFFSFFAGFLIYFRLRKSPVVNRESLINALSKEKEDLFDDLHELEERYESGEVSNRLRDIEAAKIRERLALVMRRLDQENQAA
jgi:hypothetical protein